ncbi:MAG TPA: OmpA family protein [Nitrococcus sp.]|nr:OmpA family protein [Nitrococcus sp.]
MNNRIPACLLASALLTACTSVPTQQRTQMLGALTQAQQTVAAAAADPQVQKYTATELKKAQDTLQAAQSAWTQQDDPALAEHLAYMAQRRAQIAQAEATAQAAAAQSNEITQQLAQLKPKQTTHGVVLTLGDVLFAYNSAKLRPAAQAPLDKLATFLRQHPQRQVRIVGYTDSTGSAAYNQRLSERRAQSVADALAQRGIERTRMEVAGKGKNNPVASNATAGGRQLNRRVEITVLDQPNQPSQLNQPNQSNQPNQP